MGLSQKFTFATADRTESVFAVQGPPDMAVLEPQKYF